MLSAIIKTKIKLAHEADRAPVRGKSGNVILKFGGGGYRFLVKGGKTSAAGDYYKELTGKDLGERWDADQVPTKRSRTEFITVDGDSRAVRTWDPTKNKYNYTSLGKAFFAKQQKEYIVGIPVLIVGQRLNGRGSYEIAGTMPVSAVGIPNIMANQALSDDQRTKKIKSEVLKNFAEHRYENAKLVVYEVSDEIYYFRKDGQWDISELNTAAGAGDAQAVLNRPLASLP
jgi:hypothetical protein